MNEPVDPGIANLVEFALLLRRARSAEASFENEQETSSLAEATASYLAVLEHKECEALDVEERFAIIWTHAYLRFVLYNRDGRRGDVEHAVAGFQRALELLDADADDIGLTLMHLGSALREFGLLAGSTESLVTALEHFNLSLERIEDEFRLEARCQRAVCLWRLAQTTGIRTANQIAMSDLAKALEVAQNSGEDIVPISLNLIAVLKSEYELFGEETALDLAISHCETLARLIPEGTLPRGSFLTNFASVLGSRFQGTGDARDLDRAIIAAKQAVIETPDGHAQKPSSLNNLGGLLASRWELGRDPMDLANALLAHSEAANTGGNHSGAPIFWNSLSTASFRAFLGNRDPILLNNAVIAGGEACARSGASHPLLPVFQSNYATALLERFRQELDPDDLSLAIETAHSATNADLTLELASRLSTYSACLFTKANTEEDEYSLNLAIETMERAVQAASLHSSDRAAFQLNLADMLIRDNRAPEADQVLETAINELRMRIVAGDSGVKSARLIQKIARRRAAFLFSTNRLRDLLNLALSSRSIWMDAFSWSSDGQSERLTGEDQKALETWHSIKRDERLLRHRVHAGKAGPGADKALAEIAERVAALQPKLATLIGSTNPSTSIFGTLESGLKSFGDEVVVCLATDHPEIGLIALHATWTPKSWLLDSECFSGIVEDSLLALPEIDEAHSLKSISLLLAPLAEWINKRTKTVSSRGISLVLTETLSALPIEAVLQATGMQQCRFARISTPARRALEIPKGPSASALIVADSLNDLPFARLEATELAGRLNRSKLLIGDAAIPNMLKAESGNADIIHLALHASFEQDSFLDAHFRFPTPDGQATQLHLDSILSGELPIAPGALVVLTACESGQHDRARRSEEHLGFASAFEAAGAGGVITCLWQVPDLAAAVFSNAFYESVLDNGTSVADAVQIARQSVRRVGRDTLNELINRARNLIGSNEWQARRTLRLTQFWLDHAGSRPFEDPNYWAGFVYHGSL